MAVNSSSYSVLPIPIHTNNDYASAMRGSTPVFAPRYASWEADDLYYVNWENDFQLLNLEDDLYWMECEVDQRFSNGGEADRCGSYDPVDMLPSDPFGMELSTSFAAAIADWAGDFGASPSEYGFGGDYLVTGWSYDFNRGSASSSELQLSFGGSFDVWEDRFLGPSQSAEEDMEDFLSSNVAEADHSSGDESVPHEGLLFALGHLGVKDLLSVEMVCRSLHLAVQTETLLWRCIHIDSPLSERITDDALLRLTQRAQGSLQCLSLVCCSRITDDGLRHVLECNPRLKKLGVPGCVRLSINGLIKTLKAVKASSGKAELKCLKLGRFFSVSPAQFEDLKLLVVSNECREMKPRYYHSCVVSPLACDEDRSMDVEKCPMCDKYKLVYDCPSESCRGQCRACEVCIARCVYCGRCISDRKYVETFCLEYLCSDCWKHMPPQSPERLLWDRN